MDNQFKELVRYVLTYVENTIVEKPKNSIVLRQNIEPDQLQNNLVFSLQKKGSKTVDLLEIIQQIIDKSLITNHPYFMNQMFGKTQAISFIADVLISALNTSMYTYEVAPVFSIIEKEVINKLGSKIWGKGKGDGVFTSGGSMSNMNALFLARQSHLKQIKQKGLFQEKPFAIFVSEQAHYSFTKGVNFLGFGINSLYKIPSTENAKIDIHALRETIIAAKKEGRQPLMLIGIAGTTISGTFDDLDALASIAKKHELWFHVDAAYGGSFMFTKKHQHKFKGIENADSVTWNFHKVMGMNLSTASLLTKEKGKLNKAFNVDAGYLFHQEDYKYDLGQKSIQGGRRPDAFKIWLTWKYQGENGLAKHVNKLHHNAIFLAEKIDNHPYLELFEKPETAIVCFRYIDKNKDKRTLNILNQSIRNTIFDEGKMLFNYAQLNGKTYLRCVIIDPDFTKTQLNNIVKKVIKVGDKLSKDTKMN